MTRSAEQIQAARERLRSRADRALGLGSIGIRRRATVSVASPALPTPQIRSEPPQTPVPPALESKTVVASDVAVPIPSRFIDFSGAALSTGQKRLALEQLNANEVVGCTRCRLHESRTQTVFGEGDADAQIVFIGEGPGENEDLAGRPFIGRAGQLLEKMIVAMGLSREKVYICNIVKCRPPNNRQPAPDETATCTPYLLRQLQVIRPKVIVTLGLPSTQFILNSKNSMSKMRGQWHDWNGLRVMPTYHPAYVLRAYTRQTREAVWSDLRAVLVELNLPVPPRAER